MVVIKLLGIILLIFLGALLGSVDYSTKYFIKYLEPSIEPRKEIVNHLINQFNPFRKDGINMEDIEAIYSLPEKRKKELEICRFQIIDKVVYGQSSLSVPHSSASNIYRVLGVALQRIVKTHNIGNIDFLVLGVDSIDAAPGIEHLIVNSPTFMMSKDLSSNLEHERLLLPDPYILTEKNWPKLVKEIIEGSQKYPWHKKDSTKIFWRGTTTGRVYNLENYDKIPRLTLAMLSRSFPELIDAQFTFYTNFAENDSGFELFRILTTLLDNSGHLTESEHLKYKYLVSVDGNTCAWARVPWIMLSNSVLLKQ
ncbi:MAG: glycosyl transferase family 90, partial [Janthinobacterium lividum]